MLDPYKEAREYLGQITEKLGQGLPRFLPLSQIMPLAQIVWRGSYRRYSNDLEAFRGLITQFNDSSDSTLQLWGANIMLMPAEQIFYFWAARWADQAFPVIEVGHKFAALLMATGVDHANLEEIPLPFRAFAITIPKGLLTLSGKDDDVQDVVRVHVHFLHREDGTHVCNFMICGDRGLQLWRHGIPLSEFMHPQDDETSISWQEYLFAIKSDDRDNRVSQMVSRLIVGLCLAMADTKNVKKVGKSHSSSHQIRDVGEPSVRVFKVGRPIKIDVREVIRDYVEGRRHSGPSVQCLVRGHWRRQAHGPHAEQRKWVHVEPYWRGPKDAPIVFRPHKIGNE